MKLAKLLCRGSPLRLVTYIRSDIWEGNVKDDLTITMGKKLKLMPDNLEVAGDYY